jgi:hypothetical protein
MMEQYLDILMESLHKKIGVLDSLAAINVRQKECMAAEPVDYEGFDGCVDEKDRLIQDLDKMDEGFELAYAHVKEELPANREKYAAYVRRMQDLISEVMDKSVSLQAQEERNRQAVEDAFRRERKGLRQGRKSSKAAMDYYRNVSSSNVMPPQFMDKKK